MSWIISPPEATSWSLDRNLLIASLARDWPAAAISRAEADSPTEDVVWTIGGGPGEFRGSMDREGTGFYLDGAMPQVAGQAAWLRGVVPAEVELWLYDDTFSSAVVLPLGSTPEAVLGLLDAGLD
jgi:hypothetical protein